MTATKFNKINQYGVGEFGDERLKKQEQSSTRT
jgi:hypothetical protein